MYDKNLISLGLIDLFLNAREKQFFNNFVIVHVCLFLIEKKTSDIFVETMVIN